MGNKLNKAPLLLFFFLLCFIYTIQLLPKAGILPDYWPYIGWVLIVLSFYNLASCIRLFLLYKTTLWLTKPTCLVTERFFQYSRNPIYLIIIVLLTGISLLTKNPLSLIAPITFYVISDKWLVPIEERLMIKTFGMNYLDYKEKVRRWL